MSTFMTRLRNKDTMKVTEELLKDYKSLKLGIISMKEQLELIDEEMITLPDTSYSEKVQMSTTTRSQTENIALELVELKKDLKIQIKETEVIVKNIERGLNNLNQLQREVIEIVVIDKKSWAYACDKLKYGETQLREKKKEAIKAVSYSIFGFSIDYENNLLSRL